MNPDTKKQLAALVEESIAAIRRAGEIAYEIAGRDVTRLAEVEGKVGVSHAAAADLVLVGRGELEPLDFAKKHFQ